ncbi:AAA family ATPase [Oscillospiraceae bacterium CM]|nr:AAA family ATPase [Oscillospiraceae bacterium CM]
MIIKRLSASFGLLQNKKLLLEDGLNIIYAPNESGKSTWCAFIRTMLYGLKTADRDKAGYLSDKTRYRPWSGTAMEGTMELEIDGRAVTIQRTSSGRLPMKDFSAVFTGTNEPFPGLFPDTAGETLTGVGEAVFERSAFISQAGMRIGQTPELEKRISALVTTGDETDSFSESDERLRQWLRKRRFNKSGTIPALEEKISALDKNLSRIEENLERAADARLEAENLQKRQTALKNALKAWDDFDASQALRQASEKLQSAKAAFDDSVRALSGAGPAPAEAIAAVRGDLKALEALKAVAENDRLRLDEARARLTAAEAECRKDPFNARGGAADVDAAAAFERTPRHHAARRLGVMLLGLLTVAGALVAVFLPGPLRWAAALAGIIGVILLIWLYARENGLKKKRRALFEPYGVQSASELESKFNRYNETVKWCQEAKGDVVAAEKSVLASEASLDAVRESLLKSLRALSPDAAIDNAEATLAAVEALLLKRSAAEAAWRAAQGVADTLAAGRTAREAAPLIDGMAKPEYSRPALQNELQIVSQRLSDLTNRYNMMLGETRALGDPLILGSDKIAAESALSEQRAQYEALTLAVETLHRANAELQTRFSPLLSETAGAIISKMTAGRYEKLAFDRALDASARTADEAVSRNVLALSAGTADQIYLALRLAVSALIMPSGKTAPLILDDALSNFDDRRAALALDYLLGLSNERQILLFSCHRREADYFKENGSVNIISLV